MSGESNGFFLGERILRMQKMRIFADISVGAIGKKRMMKLTY
jgi:hypothetical protein